MISSAGLRAVSAPGHAFAALPLSRIGSSSVIRQLTANGSRTLVTRAILGSSANSTSTSLLSRRKDQLLISPFRTLEHARFASTTSPSNPSPSITPRSSTTTSTSTTQPLSEADPDTDPDSDPDAPPPGSSAYTRFKLLAKKYGWYAFGMYWILSTVDFTLTYIVVHSLGSERIEPIIGSSLHAYRMWRHGEEGTLELEKEDQQRREEAKAELEGGAGGGGKKKGYVGSRMFWAEVALAYTIHKIALLPFRAGLTVAWTPKVVRWLQARGWAGKEGTGRAIAHAQQRYKDVKAKTKGVTKA